ncbi:MAG: hypothetical protein PHN56_06650 [Candidatus Nanoarchaeia archaeon]|nr:hypothetical protein [Candidatus Nanoarchaeia archaeon]
MSSIALNKISDEIYSKINQKNFLEDNLIELNFILSRTNEEKKWVTYLRQELESSNWDYEYFCKKNNYKFNYQLGIFAKKENMPMKKYLQELFKYDNLNTPLIYEGEIINKKNKVYYPIYTVWAADLNLNKASSQIGDVEQIVFEFEKKDGSLIPLRMARKSHYYPNCLDIKSKNIWWAFNCGNHYPYFVSNQKVNEGIDIKAKGSFYKIGSQKDKEFYYINFGNLRGTLNKKDFYREKIVKKMNKINKEVKLPFFDKNWSYINPELMFSPKGKLLGCLDAIVYTF